MNARTKFQVRSFTRCWDNRGLRKIGAVPETPTLPFLKKINGLLFGWTLWMYQPNLKSVALPVPEIIGNTLKKLASPRIRPRSLCSDIFNRLVRMDPVNVTAKFEVRAPPVPEIITIEVLGGGCEPLNLGEDEAIGGRRWYHSKKRWNGEFLYRPAIVTFPLSLRVSEILSLLCSSTPLLSTPPPVLPNFPMFLGNRWMGFGLRRANVLA